MRKITQPNFSVEDILNECILTTTPRVQIKAMENSKEGIISAETDYEDKILKGLLFSTSQMAQTPYLTGNKLIQLYEYRMLQKPSVRVYYDKIKSIVRNERCPFCNKQVVKTVDHYLPKTKYPIYSITPINLVAACRDCNTEKDNYFPRTRDEELLHPYYDDIENCRWLFAKIHESLPIIFDFFVNPPEHWDTTTTKRVENHLEVLKLRKMYSSYAAGYVEDIRRRLKELYQTIGETGVKEHLQEEYESCYDNDKNSYKTALLECLIKNNWFLNGGFIEP